MKHLIAVALALALLASPLICVAAGCDLTKPAHDCCPRSRAVTSCPYDVLDTAKASRPPVPLSFDAVLPLPPAIAFAAERFAPHAADRFLANGRDLHTRVRVLLI